MGSLRFSDFANSPAMILPPYQHSFGPVTSYHSSLQQYHSSKTTLPVDPAPSPHFKPPLIAPRSGNKRKRDSFDIEPAATSPLQQLPTSASESPVNPMISGENQAATSTFDDGKSYAFTGEDLRPFPSSAILDADALSSRQKFRRRETSDTLELTTVNNSIVPATPNAKTQEQAIDELTHLLGVGWTRIGSDVDLQKATRGWEKYIENHYPLTEVAILATSKALDGAFLTLARNYSNMALRRFLLFSEDLTEGRLIASSWGTCLARLQSNPIVFESEEMLKAANTPDLTPTSDASGELDLLPEGMEDLAALPPLPMDDEGVDDVMICD